MCWESTRPGRRFWLRVGNGSWWAAVEDMNMEAENGAQSKIESSEKVLRGLEDAGLIRSDASECFVKV